MGTSKSSDLICVTRLVKARLANAKGSLTYGALIDRLLRATDVKAIRIGVDEEASRIGRRSEALRALERAGIEGPRRTSSKQILIARIAEARWRR